MLQLGIPSGFLRDSIVFQREPKDALHIVDTFVRSLEHIEVWGTIAAVILYNHMAPYYFLRPRAPFCESLLSLYRSLFGVPRMRSRSSLPMTNRGSQGSRLLGRIPMKRLKSERVNQDL